MFFDRILSQSKEEMNKRDPLTLVVGDSGILNGEVLSLALRELNTQRVGVANLSPYSKDTDKAALSCFLLETDSLSYRNPASLFKQTTTWEAEEVQLLVIDGNLAIGDSLKDGDFTGFKKVFPSLRTVVEAYSHNRVEAVHQLPSAPAAVAA